MKLLSADFGYEGVRNLLAAKNSKYFDDKFIIGIEVEAEAAGAGHSSYTGWQAHADGSLRNNGIEYTSLPMAGGAIDKYVNSFYDGIPTSWSFSQRTSTHVHVNIQDFSYDELARLLLVYCAVEPLLFDFVGADRGKSVFCTPLTESVYPDFYISKVLKADRGSIRGWEKYSAVNLSRANDLGTIEFRHMHGTRDKAKVFMWLRILHCMYQFSRKTPLDDIISLFAKADENTIINGIFEQQVADIFMSKELKRLFRHGLRSVVASVKGFELAQKIALSRTSDSPWHTFKENN